MIKINLLPFRAARTKKNIRRQVSILFLSFILITIVLSIYNSHLNSRITGLKGNVISLEKDVSRYRKKAREVDKIKKNLSILKQKIAVISNLEKHRKVPVSVMETFTEVLIPQRMWLTDLVKNNRNINLKGIALDNKTVADFMVNLEKTSLFSNINLKKLQQKKVKNTKHFKEFEINCLMSLPE
jgi:type IV pilus assembly protein PilN